LTHLSYFGYCFNPVSFYYILKKGNTFQPENIEAIVAEVSNTPWNEMKCYVLHPDSMDMMQVKDGRPNKNKSLDKLNDNGIAAEEDGEGDGIDGEGITRGDDPSALKYVSESTAINTTPVQGDDWKSINYIFKKQFHVSPFMDMDHIYDWTFWHLTDKRVVVSATMKKPIQSPVAETDETSKTEEKVEATNTNTVKYFNAFFDIERKSFHPLRLCYQLIRFPVYCMIIQVWIHIEAFKLFFKGVEFVPHPEGAETGVSRIIGYAMAPFFTVKDWLANRGSNTSQAEVLASTGVHVKAE